MVTPITGSIYLVSDIETVSVSRQMPKTRIISLTEEPDYMKFIPDSILGTVFLPPYECMIYLSDGDYANFREVYLRYLTGSPELDLFLSVVTRAVLIEGINIVLFVPKDEVELGFFQILAEYIFNCFGIMIGNNQAPFMYNPAFDASNCEKMYLNGFMDVEELMVNFPMGVQFSPMTVQKLAEQMGGMIPLAATATIVEYGNWLFNYKERIKQNNNTFLQRGLIRL